MTRSPNLLAALLRYWYDAVAYARGEPLPAQRSAKARPRRLLFRDELSEMARGYYYSEEPVDVEKLWGLAVTSSWVGSNMGLLASRISAVSMEVKRREGERMVDVQNHPAERLLANPNPIWPGSLVIEYGVLWYLLRGNAYWFISTPSPGRGEPVEIWPLVSSMVRPMPETMHDGRGAFKGQLVIDYEYTINGKPRPLPGENVVHWRTANPFDFWEGLSPLNAAQMGLQVDYEQGQWLYTFYGEDNAVPTAVISLPADIDDQTFDMVKDEIREQFGKQQRSAITRAGDLSVEVVEQALKDMEMVESRRFNREMLDRALGIPEGLISGGLSGDSRLAAEIAFARNRIQPMLNSLASALDARLMRFYSDEDLVLVAPDVTPQDRALSLQEFNTHSPYLSVNENREVLGKEGFSHPIADVPVKLLDLLGPRFVEGPAGPNGASGPSQGDAEVTGSGGETSDEESQGFPALQGVQPVEQEVANMVGKALDPVAEEAIRAELKRWRKVALREARAGRSPIERTFESSVLPDAVKGVVLKQLQDAVDEDGVRAAFEVATVMLDDGRVVKHYGPGTLNNDNERRGRNQ